MRFFRGKKQQISVPDEIQNGWNTWRVWLALNGYSFHSLKLLRSEDGVFQEIQVWRATDRDSDFYALFIPAFFLEEDTVYVGLEFEEISQLVSQVMPKPKEGNQ